MPYLLPLLGKPYDLKLKNGVVGLLKNLAVTPPLRDVLGQMGVVEALANSGVWNTSADMAETVQVFSISAIKHLVIGNSE